MTQLGGGPPVVGVDLGGTKILAGVVGANNRIFGRAKRPTPSDAGNDAILEAIVACIDHALADAGVGRDELAGVGIGSPGPLDPKTGIITFSANMNVHDWALAPDLARAIGKPVLLQNDVRVGGYGEFRLGAAREHRSMLAAFVGTGIGGCLIIDGKVVEGATGNAGEVGHVVVKAKGPKCGCGRHGCLEALASRNAIAKRISKTTKKGIDSILAAKVDKKHHKLKSGDLADALAAGDHVATQEIHRAAFYLGLGLGGLVNLLGPEIVVIGGGVTEALGEPFLELIRASARQQILVDPDNTIRIEPAALGDDAGMLGAALMARERYAE